MQIRKIAFLISLFIFSTTASATRYWPSTALTDWELYLNNGVAYILSTQFADHCSHNRGQINIDSNQEFDKALYAYALSAKARGKNLKYVVDSTQTTCVISALREQD